MSKLAVTSGSTISVIFLLMNLEKLLKDFLLFLSSLPAIVKARNWLLRFDLLRRYSISTWLVRSQYA